jgi:phosphoesterase RecJ-like protein
MVVELLNSVKEAKIMIFVRRAEEKMLRISFRSRCDYNVAEFTGKFGGGGHPKAAGMRFRSTFAQFRTDVLEKLLAELECI